MEKQTILNEMFARERIYIDEKVDMQIQTLSEEEELPDNCPKCKHELTELYTRPEEMLQSINAVDLVVLKCQECNQLFAFWIMFTDVDDVFTEEIRDEHEIGRKTVKSERASKRNRTDLPKKCLDAYKQGTSNPNKISERLNQLVNSKLSALQKSGLSLATINFSRNKAIDYLKDKSPSEKNLTAIIAAAIYFTANGERTYPEIWKYQGEGISERKLEEIFGITCKTIRKWTRMLSQKRPCYF